MEISYLNKRKCLHCGTPIADQEHGSTKFCEREVMPDGTIKSCHDDYHSERRKKINAPFMQLAYHQKQNHLKIGRLLEEKGEKVSLEQIDAYQIDLSKPIQIGVDGNRQFIFYFHQFAIQQLPNNKFKISKHDLNF
jgi:hypothetical protein